MGFFLSSQQRQRTTMPARTTSPMKTVRTAMTTLSDCSPLDVRESPSCVLSALSTHSVSEQDTSATSSERMLAPRPLSSFCALSTSLQSVSNVPVDEPWKPITVTFCEKFPTQGLHVISTSSVPGVNCMFCRSTTSRVPSMFAVPLTTRGSARVKRNDAPSVTLGPMTRLNTDISPPSYASSTNALNGATKISPKTFSGAAARKIDPRPETEASLKTTVGPTIESWFPDVTFSPFVTTPPGSSPLVALPESRARSPCGHTTLHVEPAGDARNEKHVTAPLSVEVMLTRATGTLAIANSSGTNASGIGVYA
eukprot:Amastigsp_a508627_82.p2 type:complete len:310 gc:universal Amastigsp_a508627_82:1138-209(-)